MDQCTRLHSSCPSRLSRPHLWLWQSPNLDKTETVEVESGKLLRLEFTHFHVQGDDYVKITDGDGTTLMDKSYGSSSTDPSSSFYFLPPNITTRSNRVEIFFHTNGINPRSGWSLSWSAVTPGVKALTLNSMGTLINWHCRKFNTI